MKWRRRLQVEMSQVGLASAHIIRRQPDDAIVT